MGQAHQRHSPAILTRPRKENRRKPRAPLIWPNTGSTIVFRRAYNARPPPSPASPPSSPSPSPPRATARASAAPAACVVLLPPRRHVRVEAQPLQPRDRLLAEVAAVHRRRDRQRPPGSSAGRRDPGRLQVRQRRLRPSARPAACRCAAAVTSAGHDDLARPIHARLGVAAVVPPLVALLHDLQLGVGEVRLRLVRRAR